MQVARRVTRWVGAGLAMGLLLAGCQWPQVGYGPEHRRHHPDETDLTLDDVASLDVAWASPLARPDLDAGPVSEPIVADGRVYVSRGGGNASGPGGVWASARDAGSGAVVWDRELAAGNLGNLAWPVPNARTGDRLTAGWFGLVGTRCGSGSFTLDPATGADAGAAVTGTLVSPAVTVGATVVTTRWNLGEGPTGGCHSPGGLQVVARDLASGAVRWQGSIPGAVSPSQVRYDAFMPAVGGNRVFVTWGSIVRAYPLAGCGAATCNPIWSVDLGTRVSDTTPPVVTGLGRLLVVTQSGELRELAGSTGGVVWRADIGWTYPELGIGRRPGVALAGDVAYVTTPADPRTGTGTNVLRAFATGGCGAPTCPPLWTAPLPDDPSAPTVAGGVVYVGTAGAVHAFDAGGCGASTCAPVADVAVDGHARYVTVAGGKVYVSTDTHVLALAPAG